MKILVIRLKQIGDALISLPVCSSLKQALPDAQVDYLVYEHIAPLFHGHPDVDNVLSITPQERANPWRYFKLMHAIRAARYDLVIDLLTVPVTVLMTRYSGARLQLGFDKGKWRSRLYKTAVTHPRSGGSLDAKLSILDGLPFETPRLRKFEVFPTEQELSDMRLRMGKSGLTENAPILMFSPISRLGSKNWPAESFAKVVDECLLNFDVQAVFIAGPDEREAVESTIAMVKNRDSVAGIIETPDLRALVALSRLCTLFIGNDSGPRHVAEAAGTPTFTIFSPPISKFAWLPHRGDHHRGIDMCDALNIDEAAWHQQVHLFQRDMDKYYDQITPDLVMANLMPMLRQLLSAPGRIGGEDAITQQYGQTAERTDT